MSYRNSTQDQEWSRIQIHEQQCLVSRSVKHCFYLKHWISVSILTSASRSRAWFKSIKTDAKLDYQRVLYLRQTTKSASGQVSAARIYYDTLVPYVMIYGAIKQWYVPVARALKNSEFTSDPTATTITSVTTTLLTRRQVKLCYCMTYVDFLKYWRQR